MKIEVKILFLKFEIGSDLKKKQKTNYCISNWWNIFGTFKKDKEFLKFENFLRKYAYFIFI